MSIEWPTNFWRPPETDADTEDLRAARNSAADTVFRERKGRAIVAVSGSGTSHEYKEQANYLGKELARLGFTLTTGGLDGVMFDVTHGFVHMSGKQVLGKAIGIVPKGKMKEAEELKTKLPGSIPFETELTGIDSHGAKHKGPASRNHVLVATADAVVCMPGGKGSIDEAMLANKIYKKRVAAFAPEGGTQTEWHSSIESLKIELLQTKVQLSSWLKEILSNLDDAWFPHY